MAIRTLLLSLCILRTCSKSLIHSARLKSRKLPWVPQISLCEATLWDSKIELTYSRSKEALSTWFPRLPVTIVKDGRDRPPTHIRSSSGCLQKLFRQFSLIKMKTIVMSTSPSNSLRKINTLTRQRLKLAVFTEKLCSAAWIYLERLIKESCRSFMVLNTRTQLNGTWRKDGSMLSYATVENVRTISLWGPSIAGSVSAVSPLSTITALGLATAWANETRSTSIRTYGSNLHSYLWCSSWRSVSLWRISIKSLDT